MFPIKKLIYICFLLGLTNCTFISNKNGALPAASGSYSCFHFGHSVTPKEDSNEGRVDIEDNACMVHVKLWNFK
jgi:hypothetical protein